MIFNWTKWHISSAEEANEAFDKIAQIHPKYHAFDTETTGLHIIKDKPFLYQFGFIDEESKRGWAYSVDIERQPELAKAVIKSWHDYLAKGKHILIGQNIKYDLNMCINLGLPVSEDVQVTDLQFWIRYGNDALHTSEGGPPMALKDFATKYVDRNAKLHEHALKNEQSTIAKTYNNRLKAKVQACQVPAALRSTYKSVTLSCLNELFKDPIFEITELPKDILDAYIEWKDSLPLWLQKKVITLVEPEHIPYNKLNREILIKYALDDIVWTLESFWKCRTSCIARKNVHAVKIENDLIFPLLRMERVGFKIDREYLEESRKKLKAYIVERRQLLRELTGAEFKIGQHAFIKEMLANDFDWSLPSTGAGVVDMELSKLIRENPSNPAIKVMQLIQELRTLEKWYSAYIIRFQKVIEYYNTDRLYTQMNQVGAVSGRFTSDFQQFPKEAITKEDGTELFHPRKMVIVPKDEGFIGLGYCDFSQIELRFQAFYTILVGAPDLNLCRAYMPYKCHKKDGTKFDYTNPDHIKHWADDWYLDENPEEKWTATDVHAATTIAAGYSKDDPNFKHYRTTVGKRTNFAKNYGAQLGKIKEMYPDKSEEECQRINDAYYKAFPGVKNYHQYCYNRASYSYTVNMFGVKYYNVSGHKLINMLVQGSAAYYLKLKIIELDKYIQENHLKTRMQMNIHDEVDFEVAEGEKEQLWKFKEIMEDWPEGQVPIVAEPDWSTTNWAEKSELTKEGAV